MLQDLLPIILAVLICLSVIALLVAFGKRSTSTKKGKGGASKNRAQVIKESTKKLAKDPHNVRALSALGELYFTEHLWDKAVPLYETLMNLADTNQEIDKSLVCLRHGICCVKLNKSTDALKSLVASYKLNARNYEVNYYLGKACFDINDYEKAIPCFKKAVLIKPDATGISGQLGLSMYHLKKYRDAIPYLKKALDENTQDKEALFAMADSMTECGAGNKALKVFMHMRADPVFGPKASLSAGMIHAKSGMYDDAVQDFEIGLKHKDIEQDVMLELYYRLSQCYIAMKNISKGLACLTKINGIVSNYKDVSSLIARYKELNQNTNLQLYLNSGPSDFVALCRKVVSVYYSGSTVKITNVEVKPDIVEVACDVETPRWEDSELFRFYKTIGTLGDQTVRDLHAKIRDRKIDKGFCISPGLFSDGAHKYTEGRPVDLIEKEQLMKLLKKIT